LTKLLIVLGLFFQSLEASSGLQDALSSIPGLHWAPSNSWCHHWQLG